MSNRLALVNISGVNTCKCMNQSEHSQFGVDTSKCMNQSDIQHK